MGDARPPEVYEFGGFLLDTGRRFLRRGTDGEPIALTVKAFETLLHLVEHRGELVDKSALMEAVWPGVVVEENNLNQAISAVRKALGESALEHRFIVTVPGRGYRFVAPVRSVNAGNAAATAATHEPATVPIGSGPRSSPSKRALAIGAVLLVTAAALWLALSNRPDPTAPEAVAAAARDPERRIAIMPFENLSPDPDNAFFADGLHEEILTSLARRAPALAVISRTTMMSYRQNPKPAAEVAQELGATHLLEGTVRREAQNVRLTVQLIDATADRQVWSQNYDRTLTSALTLQSEVASQVAAQLSVQFAGGTQLAVPETRDPEAYDLYLKALVARLRVSPFAPFETFREVDDLLTRSLELDPSFVAAYAQRATFRGAMFAFNFDISRELVQSMRDDLAFARRLAPADPTVLAAEALYWSWIERDLPHALELYQQAESAGLADAMYEVGKAGLLARIGRPDEAFEAYDRIRSIDPGNLFVRQADAATRMSVRRYLEALRIVDDGLLRTPDVPTLHLLRGQIIFFATGRLEPWGEALARHGRMLPPIALLEQQFQYLCLARRYEELQSVLDGTDERALRVIAGPGGGGFFGVGEMPTAKLRGWLALLRGQRAIAAENGREVLDFVAAQEEKPWNAWYLRVLESSGALLVGDHKRAVSAARKSMELMPRQRDYYGAMSARYSAAQVLAWAGQPADALDLLEASLSEQIGFGYGVVSRDPFLAAPLADDARYRKMVASLEAKMKLIDLAE